MDREAVTADRSKEITGLIRRAAQSAANEAEFRTKFSRVVEDFAKELDIPLLVRQEYTLATGLRADAAYNRLILEYEPPGSLRQSLTHKHTAHAVNQVKGYIEGVAEKERQKIHRLVGVALDGHYFIFVRHVNGRFLVEQPVPVNEHTTGRFLRLLVSLTSGKALLPENLIKDFGSHTLTAERVAKGFYEALNASLQKDPEGLIAKLFKQWQTFYGEVTGYGIGSTQIKHKTELQEFARGMGVDPRAMNPPLLFFSVHTYFSLLVKLIAYLALSRFVSGFGTRFGSLYSLDNEALAKEVNELERGGLFRRIGIRNFLEGDFFRWYLRTWNDDVADAVRLLVTRLKDYDPGTLEVSPEAARDLLKKLYHYLMPGDLRHDLGEYYTPDWLAERLLNQLGYDGHPRRRLLDPACGSGTFLILAINRLKDRCLNKVGMNEQETLKTILGNIAGVDLNPLAVIAARTNFLLAVRDLLEHRTEDIDIPVYLADSIVSPEVGKTLFNKDRYQIKTTVGPLEIPSALKSRDQIEELANVLGECAETDVSPGAFLARGRKKLGIADERWEGTDGEGEPARDILDRLYRKLASLHREGLDGIWAAIVKNYFMPLFIGHFDLVAGNPPWVIWDNLPADYRNDTKPIWVQHGLFPHGGMDSILGKSKKDISMLMTYEVAEALLKKGGRLGFVITQSVFKTAGSGQGFRRFRLGSGTPLGVVHVDDMVDFQPFEEASNRTAVLIIEKGGQQKHRVPYTVWQKTVKGKKIGYDLPLGEVSEMTRRLHHVAEPVDQNDSTSIWLTARPKAIKVIRKMLGTSDYEAHAGAYSGGANAVYWVEKIQDRKDGTVLVKNVTEGAKRDVDEIQAILEAEFLHPLLRGNDVRRWNAKPSAYILLVQEPKMRRGIDENLLQRDYPKTWAYVKHFEDVLEGRKDRGTRQIIQHGGAFYSMFGVGEYTVSRHKVVWGRIGRSIGADAVSTQEGRPIVPQETHTFVAVDSKEEALYLAAVLNSLPFNFAAVSYSQAGGKSFASPHILENIRVPKFESKRPYCGKLAKVAERAKKAAATSDQAELKKVSAQINETVLEMWGLTQADLKEIEAGYAEITKADLETDEDAELVEEGVTEEA
ncbi:MAG: N-6 DNA methylase [Candidatus Methylomirabilales bacterium]